MPLVGADQGSTDGVQLLALVELPADPWRKARRESGEHEVGLDQPCIVLQRPRVRAPSRADLQAREQQRRRRPSVLEGGGEAMGASGLWSRAIRRVAASSMFLGQRNTCGPSREMKRLVVSVLSQCIGASPAAHRRAGPSAAAAPLGEATVEPRCGYRGHRLALSWRRGGRGRARPVCRPDLTNPGSPIRILR